MIAESQRFMSATLRAEPQPRLVKIRPVKVETSPMFAHLYEDGKVIIDDLTTRLTAGQVRLH